MMKIAVVLSLAVLLCNANVEAKRPPGSYGAILSGAKEMPPVKPATMGLVDLYMNKTAGSAEINGTLKAITNVFVGHIHLGNSTTNGPVIYKILPLDSAALNPALSGTIAFAYTFNISSVNFPLTVLPANSSSDTIYSMFMELLGNRGMYVNFHTLANPGGELRGQLHN